MLGRALYSRLMRLIITVLLAAITFGNSSYAAERITVFAAASLTNALTDIAADFEQQHSATNPTKVRFSFASSSTLARQVAQGAPAQLYLSADQRWLDYLIEQNAVNAESRVTLVGNSLVLIAPKSTHLNNVTLNADWDLRAAIGDSRLAVADPDHVPAGRYAKQALQHLQLCSQAAPLLARANNVRGALVLVERGEAPLGIVYGSDAQISQQVHTLARFPADSHTPIEYPLVLVDKQPSTTALAFYHYLQSPAAQAVFSRYGFQSVNSPEQNSSPEQINRSPEPFEGNH